MVAEKVNDSRGFGLGNDIRAYALAYQFKRSGELDPALLPGTGDPIVNDLGYFALEGRNARVARAKSPPYAKLPR